MTPVLKLGFCPPMDQPRLWCRGAIAQGTVWPDRVGLLPPPFEEQRCRCGCGLTPRLSRSRPADRKPDSGKVCVARGTSISQLSNADRRVSGRLRTAGFLERHQLGRAGSATLPQKIIASLTPAQSGSKTKEKTSAPLNCTPQTQAPKG